MDQQAAIAKRGRRIKIAAEIALARSSGGRHWSRALRRRLLRRRAGPTSRCRCSKEPPTKAVEHLAGGEDEEVEIEQRVRALQRLVPGGEALAVDRLFEETADYIEALEGQVRAMRALASFLDGVERERRKLGG